MASIARGSIRHRARLAVAAAATLGALTVAVAGPAAAYPLRAASPGCHRRRIPDRVVSTSSSSFGVRLRLPA